MHTLTVLLPLRADADPDAVAARLAALGVPGPFAASEVTHFARLVVIPARLRPQPRPATMRRAAKVIDLVTHLGRPPQRDDLWRPYLLFSAAYDTPGGRDGADADPAGDYVRHLASRLGAQAD